MDVNPRVSVVILNYNGQEFLAKFLPFVLQSTYSNMEVVVADNASTDDSLSLLRRDFPQVRIIINKSNEGFSKGYNTALSQVSADYFVLLNSDVEVTPGWIEPIIELMREDSKIAACQPKLLSWHDRSKFEYAGASGGWIDSLGYPFMRGRVIDDCETDKGQYNTAVPCFWASGAALFVKAAAFHEVGGLDAYFFAHQEEIDLCWRLHLAGYKVYVQPASVVYHVGGGTLPQSSKKVYLNFRNNLVMIYKNMPYYELLWKLPLRFILNLIAALRYLFSGRMDYFMAIHRSKMHFFRWLFFEKKKSVFPKRIKGLNREGRYRGSIVWAYFIRGMKTFSEIVENK